MSDDITVLTAAHSGDTHEVAHRLIQVNATYDAFLYKKAGELDPVVDCSRSSKACVAASMPEKEDSHGHMQDASICDDHPEHSSHLAGIEHNQAQARVEYKSLTSHHSVPSNHKSY